ncbi:TenA family protein [Pseudonocardia sp. GCM10023141]|uniref:TenA family protein n=1 Tax=Pseudonocardia sp. GCM10023141 TaxID=3252653 RepID=UPI00360E4B4E
MSFSARLREHNASTWDAAVGHRFVTELWLGTVDPAALQAYFVQDNQFFDAFVAMLGATVAGADRPGPRIALARQLGLLAGPENDFFARVLDAFDVPLPDRSDPELVPATRGFLDLMHHARTSGDYATCLAVLLVAEWLYLDWADRPDAEPPADAIALEWIDLHRGPAFAAWVQFLRTEFDRATAALDDPEQERVAAVFARAVTLELEFFDAACAAV